MTDHEQIMISALRYALGRRTYVVSDTVRYISEHLDGMTDHCRNVMVRDIKEQSRWGYGDPWDEKCWMLLLKTLEERSE